MAEKDTNNDVLVKKKSWIIRGGRALDTEQRDKKEAKNCGL